MEIPKQIRIGRSTYDVTVRTDSTARYYGSVSYNVRSINVHTTVGPERKPRTKRQVTHTFWHEVVHAILYDMGSPLESNELFVDAFAKRITDVIRSAKF